MSDYEPVPTIQFKARDGQFYPTKELAIRATKLHRLGMFEVGHTDNSSHYNNSRFNFRKTVMDHWEELKSIMES